MDPDEAFTGGARGGSGPPPPPIIGAEDEDFENDIETPPDVGPGAFQDLEQLRQRPAHLVAFLHHALLQFDAGPVLCYLHAAALQRLQPKESRKQLLEFTNCFLGKGAPLRVSVPPHLQQELERMRPELLAEEAQRRFLRELQAWQEPEVARQLEDFRSKRLMGMTPGEAELAELAALRPRDPGRELQLAEALLGRLEDMHLTISPDEEKSAAILGAVAAALRPLGVRPRGGGGSPKKSPNPAFSSKRFRGSRCRELAGDATGTAPRGGTGGAKPPREKRSPPPSAAPPPRRSRRPGGGGRNLGGGPDPPPCPPLLRRPPPDPADPPPGGPRR